MEIIILIIIALFGVIKLNDIHAKLTSITRKIDSLQYDINGIIQGNPVESSPQAKEDKEPEFQAYQEITAPPVIRKERPKRPQTESALGQTLKKRFGSTSIIDFLVGNLLLNVSIVTFVLGVGFFLKYSIDQNWIPIWGRILIGIMIALGMLWAGKMNIKNSHKLFSEGLFGGGIAVLYLSIFAGYALEGFAFLSFPLAFSGMVTTTILAGVISVRYNSMSTAIFGLIGGFATPFLIHTDANDIQALMIYILLLNIGVLYIAVSKKWNPLNWLAFIFTAALELKVASESTGLFYFLLAIFVTLFLIYSIVPFIKEIKEKKITLEGSLLRLFGANIILFLTVTNTIFLSYGLDSKYISIITISTALYLFAYAFFLKKQGIFTKNLYFVLIAIALGLLLLTPIILFDGKILSATWAIEALILYTIAHKSAQPKMLWFSVLAFALSFFHYIGDNLQNVYSISSLQTYYHDILTQFLTAFIVIGAFFLPIKMPVQKLKGYNLQNYLALAGLLLLFTFLNVQVYNSTELYLPKAQDIAITLLWVVFGIGLFTLSLIKNIELGKQVSIGLIIVAIFKAFFHDLAGADSLYRIILFMLVGLLLFVLAYFYKKRDVKTISSES